MIAWSVPPRWHLGMCLQQQKGTRDWLEVSALGPSVVGSNVFTIHFLPSLLCPPAVVVQPPRQEVQAKTPRKTVAVVSFDFAICKPKKQAGSMRLRGKGLYYPQAHSDPESSSAWLCVRMTPFPLLASCRCLWNAAQVITLRKWGSGLVFRVFISSSLGPLRRHCSPEAKHASGSTPEAPGPAGNSGRQLWNGTVVLSPLWQPDLVLMYMWGSGRSLSSLSSVLPKENSFSSTFVLNAVVTLRDAEMSQTWGIASFSLFILL